MEYLAANTIPKKENIRKVKTDLKDAIKARYPSDLRIRFITG
jgi:hypothetical protein